MRSSEWNRNQVRLYALLWLGLLLLHSAVASGEQLPIKTYTTADGLAHDRIKRIVRDQRGFLWFCTADGLSRFDGYSFRNYGTEQGWLNANLNDLLVTREDIYWLSSNRHGAIRFDPYAGEFSAKTASGNGSNPSSPGISEQRAATFTVYQVGDEPRTNRVNVMYQDRAGRIWAGTDGGLFYLDGNTFRRVEIGLLSRPDRSLPIWAFVEDREGSLWIGTSVGLLRRLPDGRVVHYQVQPPEQQSSAEALLIDSHARLWIGYRNGLSIFVPEPAASLSTPNRTSQRALAEHNDSSSTQDGRLRLPMISGEARRYTVADGLPHNLVWALRQTRDGHIWLGTDGGLTEFDGLRLCGYTAAQGLSGSAVFTLAEDADGNLWLGTRSAGAQKLISHGFITYRHGDGLGDNFISHIFENQAGELWVSNANRFVNRFDGRRFTTAQINFPGNPAVAFLISWQMALQDHTGEWWVGSGAGLLRFARTNDPAQLARARPLAVYTTQKGLSGNNVYRLFEDARGDLWIGTVSQPALTRWERATNTFHRYGEPDGLLRSSAAMAFCEDGQGNLWFGFFEGGIARYANGRFLFIPPKENELAGIIDDIYLDRSGRLWIATQSAGVSRIDDPGAAHPRLTTYTMAAGLSSNNVRGIIEDQWGRMYFGTVRGVDRFDPATGNIRRYTTADGLSNNEVHAAFRDRHDALWFGTMNGLSRLIPEPPQPTSPPSILIDSLRITGIARPIPHIGETAVAKLDLAAHENQIQIAFLGLGFGVGEKLRYQYKLEGADVAWSVPGEARSVNYSSLRPGKYRFLVQALNSDGLASATPATVAFTILPPWWQRWWFLALVALTGGLAVYTLYRYRVAHLLALERMRTRIATDLHDDLGANLSQIAILSEVVNTRLDPQDKPAREPLESITQAARESVDAMSDIVWAINPQRDHLRDLTQRLRHFASEVLAARDIALSFRAPEAAEDGHLGADVRREIFLIFKEAVNNLARHSGCTNAEIELQRTDGWLTLTLRDNGRGFDPAQQSWGHGLASMRARAKKLSGRLEIETQPGCGTLITLKVPLVHRAAWRRHLFRW